MRITGRTALLVGVASALVLVTSLGVALAAIAIVLALAVVDAFVVRKSPSGERRIATFARGGATRFDIEVDPAGASRIEVRQPLGADMHAEQASSPTRSLSGHIVAHRRGLYELAPVAVRRDGPLGLGRWYHDIGSAQPVRVYPDLPTAHRLAEAVRRSSFRTGERRRGPLGLGTEFESVREYRTDDDVRQINWRATARLGRPMSNNLRIEQDLDVWVLIDAGRLSAASMRVANATAGPQGSLVNRLDLYLDALCAIGLVSEQLGDRFGWTVFSNTVLHQASPRRRSANAAIEATFALEAAHVESDYTSAVNALTTARRSLVLVFTDLIDEHTASRLVSSLTTITRRHDVQVITIDEPSYMTARAQPESDAQRRVMADIDAALHDARSSVAATGARIRAVHPDRVAEDAVATYLHSRSGTRRRLAG